MDKFVTIQGISYKLAPETKIPNDDPSLPSYQGDDLRDRSGELEFILDMFIGAKRWAGVAGLKDEGKAKNYIPPWSREPKEEYPKRVKRTLFHNFFAPAVKGFPGFLSDIRNVETLYPGIVENISDVDLQGNNLTSFLWQADLKVIRDGFCGVLVDMPRIPRDAKGNKLVRSLADQKKVNARPYLVLIDRRDIMSVSESFVNGKRQTERITIKEYVNQTLGDFGSEVITRYKTFWSDGRYLVQVLIERDDKVVAVTVEEGYSDLKMVPIVLYSATDICPLDAEPPLLNLAEKNRAYYELYSEYREIIHKMNTPVPVRIGVMMPGGGDDLPDMVFGANTGIDVPQGGDFKFAELSGNVLATDRAELTALEVAMNSDSLKFLSGGGVEKTATEAVLESSQLQATLSGIATLKESAIEQIASVWAGYYGKPEQGGRCQVNQDLLKMPLNAVEIQALSSLATQSQISVITLLELLKEGKRLPDSVKPSQEIQRLAAQFKLRIKQQKEAMAIAPTKQHGENDDTGNNQDQV